MISIRLNVSSYSTCIPVKLRPRGGKQTGRILFENSTGLSNLNNAKMIKL